jgi:hypothetical protein
MPLFILVDHLIKPREVLRDVAPAFVSQIFIPGLLLGLITLLPLILLARSKPKAREVVLVLFTMLFISAIVFTMVGFFFRGPGFELFMPWNMPDGYSPWNNL